MKRLPVSNRIVVYKQVLRQQLAAPHKLVTTGTSAGDRRHLQAQQVLDQAVEVSDGMVL